MEQDNKKKKKIIGISLSVVGALLLIFSGTYAYWQLTKEQSSANEIVAACLDFELSDVTEAISLERAYPISKEESESLTGYTFKVKNNCNDSIDYTIGLNSITNSSENYLANTSLRVKLDDKQSKIYETLNAIEYIENVRYSKELGTSTILGNSENTHLLKVWVDENAPVTEQGKTFTGKIIITGSVGNTSNTGGEQIADSCFAIASDGTLLAYDYSCGTDVVVPAEINGIQVKSIAGGSFERVTAYAGTYYDEVNDEYATDFVITDKEHESEIEKIILMMYLELENESEAGNHTLSEIGKKYETLDDLMSALEGKEYEINGAYIDVVSGEVYGKDNMHKITSLDLSDAIYLETIEEAAFDGNYFSDVNEGPHCIEREEKGDYDCSGPLTNVIFPENGMLTTIEQEVFKGNQLTNIEIPSSVIAIGRDSFSNNQLTSITIPSSVTTIDDGSFYNNQLSSVSFSNSGALETIGGAAFNGNQLTSIVIPGSVLTIGYGAFRFNPLTEVIIKRANADGMTIDSSAFPTGITPTYNPNYTE